MMGAKMARYRTTRSSKSWKPPKTVRKNRKSARPGKKILSELIKFSSEKLYQFINMNFEKALIWE